MDPNKNLKEQRKIAARIIANGGDTHWEGERLAELVQALDEWLTKGGFLPEDWKIIGTPLHRQ